MKKVFLSIVSIILPFSILIAQTINERLRKAYQQFEADSQMRYGISSLYVIDAVNGEVVFDKNSSIGLAPASTQKTITSVSVYELLGRDFRYQTQLGLEKLEGKNILHVYGNGDPTFRSPRWATTAENEIISEWSEAVKNAGIKKVEAVDLETGGWESETIPDGWIWQDIGNYYGAGAAGFNWRENQYDIILQSGERIGDKVNIVRTIPGIHDLKLRSDLRSAAKGTGDNAYVYYPLQQTEGIIRGTIPVGEKNFKISASLPSAFNQFLKIFAESLKSEDIKIPVKTGMDIVRKTDAMDISILISTPSPPLDSMIYWFNKKSINLYGEAFIKTIAISKTGIAMTDSGTAVVKRFWKEKGIDPDELNIYDGSGLSPLNRVTTHSQVTILKYAKDKDWFPAFYEALPEYNGMKMKSGTISDVKAFCGYQTASDGRQYIFSFIVNNYGGRTSPLVNKMYKVLDELK